MGSLTHFGAIFAAWVGGLVLFVIAGSVVAIVSLVGPKMDHLILGCENFGQASLAHRLHRFKIKHTLEHYAELTEITIAIRDFHVGEKNYRISSLDESDCSKLSE